MLNISPNIQYFSNKPECDVQETPDSDTLGATLDKSTLYRNKFRSYNNISDKRQEVPCRQSNEDLLQTDSYTTSGRIMQLCETDEVDFAKNSFLTAGRPKQTFCRIE